MEKLMDAVTGRRLAVWGTLAGSAVFAGLYGAADPTLTSQTTTLTSYFSDNIGVIIGAFVTIAALLWVLSMLFRSVGVKRASKVG